MDDDSRYKLACKARQIGFTFAATLRAVWKRLEEPGLTVWLSASERQALEAMEQVRRHVRALGALGDYSDSFVEGSQVKQHQVRFANGSRIVALPANPDTVRGFAGDIVLDEFAFHPAGGGAIWRAAFATVTRGFQLEVISTPNGTQGKFYELARQTGLLTRPVNYAAASTGHEPRVTPGRASVWTGHGPWSPHWCDIFTARSLGFGVDIESLRAAVDDEDTWQQEYCCQFLSDAANYLPLELVVAAEFSAATPLLPVTRDPRLAICETGEFSHGARTTSHEPHPCYLGVDIGRRHDKTVLWLLEETAGILWTRAVSILDREPFAAQRAAIEALLEERDVARVTWPVEEKFFTGHGTRVTSHFAVQRCCIDATGLGAMLAEELQARFGARVEPVTFTLAVKEDLAVRLKRWLEERRLRIPYDPTIRRALAAVKRYTTPTGHFRFDAARTEEGHADEFWALALACLAAEGAPLSTDYVSNRTLHAFSQAYVY